ncbi:MAG: hypothetical protein AB1640_21280 [bacterium]
MAMFDWSSINWAEILVLAVLMTAVQLSGLLLRRIRNGAAAAHRAPAAAPCGQSNTALRAHSAGQAAADDVPEEVAAVIALALSRSGTEASAHAPGAGPQSSLLPAAGERDSSWKTLGRQECHRRADAWAGFGSRRNANPTGSARP